VAQTVNGVTTYFVGNHYELTNGVVTKYYFAGATRLAVRTNGTLSYLLGDHLGSSSVTTNASGVKTASALYKAFGETRFSSGALGTDYKFTGQREQAELGLYFYGARWFDPSIGRFTSPDTIVPTGTQGTQAWDRYAYVNNNPVRYNDPTGHCIDGITTILCVGALAALSGGLIGAGMYIIAQSQAGEPINGGELALAAGVGAVAGVAMTVGVLTGNPILVGAGVGAAFGGGADLVGDIVEGEEFDASDFAIASAGNALGGALLPWTGVPVNPITAGLVGYGTNLNVYFAQQAANGDSPTLSGTGWAAGTGLVGGMAEGVQVGSEFGTGIRTIFSQTIQNLPAPDTCEEDYICPR